MTWRYKFILIILVSAFAIVVLRLFYWQVVRAEELSILGQSQYGALIKLSPKRGDIKTSDGFPIATNKVSYLVFANPKEIQDREQLSKTLSSILEVEEASISAMLSQDKFWVPLKRGVEPKKKEEVEKLKLKGVGFEQQFERFYPEASMAAHLVGITGKNELGEDKGYFGLEGFYDRQLSGEGSYAVQIKDAFGRPILSRVNEEEEEKDGRSLVLNIDRTIQFLAEKKLKEGIEKYGAAGGMVGIIEPKTGKIIAMTSFPSFSPQNFSEYKEENFKNPFISNVFEPGSTFKSLVMAAAIDAKVVKPETKCPICSKPVEIGGYEIKTWNDEYIKDINMIDVIRHSDNTGMVFAAQRLGLERILSYFKAFGIGEATGIDLQGEAVPRLRPEDSWYPIDVATSGFGQGIHLTPIELLSAFSAIANGGVRMQPQVVSSVITPDGEELELEPKELGRPISESTSKIMTEMLVNAVNKGEAQWTKVPGYRIAGKTGTAQIPIEGHYDPNKTIASFIGFAPADDPKFAMLVILDRPTTSIYGAETAAPIFFSIARDIFSHYGIFPTENE